MSHLSTDLDSRLQPDRESFAIRFHFLGQLDWETAMRLQRHLAYEAGGCDDGRIIVLVCEHARLISVGRRGSRAHVRLTSAELRAQQLQIRWVGRGGGCVLHMPGQLAVYPIVPLQWHGWTVGDYLCRFQAALQSVLQDLRIRTETNDGSFAIWGRSGALVTFGASVCRGVTYHGAFINVNPVMTTYRFIDVIEPALGASRIRTTMGSLLAERRQAITMPRVRALLVPRLADTFGTDRCHLLTGHPLLRAAHNPNKTEHSRPRYRVS